MLSDLLSVRYKLFRLEQQPDQGVTYQAINSKVTCDFHTEIHRFWRIFYAHDALTGA